MAIPDEVPILTAEDMCIAPYKRGECGCLMYYADTVFEDWWNDGGDLELALLQSHVDLETGVVVGRPLPGEDFATYSRHSRTVKRSTLARVWNRAMAMLGYVRGNPECKRNGELKPV